MTTGAFSRNVGKLFSELKLVTDNLFILNIGVIRFKLAHTFFPQTEVGQLRDTITTAHDQMQQSTELLSAVREICVANFVVLNSKDP